MRSKTRKLLACIQIVLQLAPPSSLIYLSSVFNANAEEITSSAEKEQGNPSDQNASSVAQTAVQAGSLLSSDNASDALGSAVVSAVTGKAASSAQEWLSQFGTARVNISTDEHFTLSDSELDLLVPLYNENENLLFTQLGGRRHDDRNIVNGGFGYRHFNDGWMWGTNVFYDRQVSGNQHQRLGLDTELRWDYLNVSANGYLRLSDWMSSSSYQDYDERVADGFDIRATGYLPAYPQLGANIIYEQYFGDSVGLFGDDEDDRQKDPYAVTVGLNYTPVPLVTMGLNQKMGKSGENDTQVNLGLTWTPGVPLSAQLDPSQVALRRTLQGGRLDLVDRNNNIVLEYRKQELISLALPAELEGAEQSKRPVTAKVKAKYGLDRIEWQGDSFFSHGGKITPGSNPEQVVMTLPVWVGSGSNSYTLSATAWDKKGNASAAERVNVTVNGIDVNTLLSATTVSPTKVPADGKTPATVSVTLKTSAGEAATGLASRLTAALTSSVTAVAKTEGTTPDKAPTMGAFTESGSGVYMATLTSGTTPDTLTIQPLIDGAIKLASAKLIEEATVMIPQLTTLDASGTSALASGSAPVTLTAHVTDQYGRALKDAVVNWSADNAQALLSASQSSTDESGAAQIQVTSQNIITTVVTAQLQGGNALSTSPLTFTADRSTAKVVTIDSNKKQVVANNNDTGRVTALVMDGYSHPLSGVTVNWKVEKTDNTPVTTSTSTTDSSGIAVLTLKASKTGTVTVSAEVNGTMQETDPITFVADSSTQSVSVLMADKPQATANGTDKITYTATVTDMQGNVVQGATVNWSADSADAKLSSTRTTSGADGTSQITVTSIKAGDVVVTAQTLEATATAADKVTFVADAATAKVNTITSDKPTALANGSDAITLSATIADANGNPLGGMDVNWQASPTTGKLSANSSKTDANGVARVALASDNVATYTVAASINGTVKSMENLRFTADSSTAQITSLTADKTTGIVADRDTVTLTALVVDAQQHPVSGVTVNWTSSEAASRLSVNSSVTGDDGTATVAFSSLKAGAIDVTATTGGSSKIQTLQVIGNVATAKVTGIVADKPQAVADGAETITWTATVTDANGNILTGATLNWSSSLSGVTLTPASSDTDAEGKATMKGTSLKSGEVKVTATPVVNAGGQKTGGDTKFIGDTKTARLISLRPNMINPVINSTGVTYNAVVNDANDNPVEGLTVAWTTNLNTLSAQETTTDSSGNTAVKLKGSTVGIATVTATANGTNLSNNEVSFVDTLYVDWNITGNSSSYTGNDAVSTTTASVGFVVIGETQGPTSLIWNSHVGATTRLTVPMTTDNGETVNVIFKGQRSTGGCGRVEFNNAISCYNSGTSAPVINFSADDNPTLSPGRYTGRITFKGTEWHNDNNLLVYDITVSLTVQ
ncbi:inverse autotransporter beta domain-containing protein [Citrobacter rodentium NBRC 105723 = DSM 16636]|nr:inverse autotransporter beta domain-containing protein [Citrobacter rodentium]KIQ50263.1 intimin-like protein [Citrobacter rodentium]QBY27640.1 intimin-like protein [Citrobacter rodentium]UHO30459.1 inverse autotransporter beta domain-containing protein [Citrobacter rodentium NBRC 105723 = DSM 16636]HAT8012279.1 intimin-like protein [Citrobacter rodentium NBRC 105723 = DSM 16636]HAT8017330.1 intimin-like protein [Citrobacter rodentium]